uniref:Uncharacterized protein n=1 Tax=Aegilops tauschii subsp. strangulata TaxID=200361 RepID=A0A453H4P8_AEGTS
MRSLQGALIIAGVFQAVIGFFGIWRVFIRLSDDSSLPPSRCRLRSRQSLLSVTCCTDAACASRARFLSPLAAVPFVTLSALGLFYFAFPGVRQELLMP